MKQQYQCQTIAPLVGWDSTASKHACWAVGIPDQDTLPRINGLIVNPDYPLSRRRLLEMGSLIVVSAYGVGYDYIDVEAASELGVLVTHTPQAVVTATAELGLTLVVSLLRHVVAHDHDIRLRHRSGLPNPLFGHARMAHNASSQTVGLVGYGRIGQRLRQLLEAVGFHVAYTRAHGPLPQHTGFHTLDQLIQLSDIIVLVVPLTSATHHLVDSQFLSLCKPTASLVNISRGAVVDEQSLVEALKCGALAGAALDVYEFEPQVSDALITMPQVILSPHVGTLTEETRIQMTHDAVANILEGLAGRAQNAINPDSWSRRPTKISKTN
ncbi:MAG: hypothetical protein C7B46_04560 [Sulfobacillus benefaciens]|uniref:D-glycerate dehydrogenase n=1 Tax=Sulfobacillus benefaciens TaxID=453960 RepID=A0A2T2XJP7_9FIRM|nr:MAG: hypothetical protein C7B46_04560 [Sulfobacillus benefaciens]